MGCTLCTPAGTGSPGAAGPVPQGRGYAWPVRRAAAIPWLPLVLALAGCMGAPARVPDGITVVEERAPPPPPALVEEAQRRLQARDLYHGPITGALTPAVRVAIARFQRIEDLPVTGTLDERTVQALGLAGIALPPGAPHGEAPDRAGPSARELLDVDEAPPLPQPPRGALAEARAAAARLLAGGTVEAGEEVARADALLPGRASAAPAPGSGTEAPVEGEAARTAGGADLLEAAQAAARAQGALASARREAFDLLLAARLAGGWAPLPAPLIEALEAALLERALLLRGPDRRLGSDDEAAIRWLQRSLGQEATGRPTLQLLEALGIDPGPMFEAP